MQQVVAEERERTRLQAEAARAAEASRAVQAAEDERQAEIAARQAAQKAAQQSAWQQSDRYAAPPGSSAVPPSAPQYPGQGPAPAGSTGFPPYQPYRAPEAAPLENYSQPRTGWAQGEPRENFTRPAWLASARPELPAQPLPQAPEDTLQGSRDRLTSRWYALKGVFEAHKRLPSRPGSHNSRAPVVAVFSLAGGVGKTSMVATLGRALSARGERVLLVDTAAYGLLPFFFGARDQRPGRAAHLQPSQLPAATRPSRWSPSIPRLLGAENATPRRPSPRDRPSHAAG